VQHLFLVHGLLLLAPSVQVVDLLVEVVVDPLQGLDLGDEGSDPTLRLLQSLSCTLNAINLAWWADVVDPLQGLDLGDEGTDSTLRLF
jgi:hypothetical protein